MNLETLIQTTLDSLDRELPGRLTVFNAEAGNPQLVMPPVLPTEDQPLSAVDSKRAFYAGGRETHYKEGLPAIEVALTEFDANVISLSQRAVDVSAPLLVVVWVQELDAPLPVKYAKLLGYVRCMLEVLLLPDAIGGGVKVERVRGRMTAPDPELRRFEYLTLAGLLFVHFADTQGRGS